MVSARSTPTTREAKTAGTSPAAFHVNLSRAQFETWNTTEAGNGRQLVDIEVTWRTSEERYSGIWFPVSGTVYVLLQGTTSEWSGFYTLMGPKNGRWLDVEVDYFNGIKRYSAIFYEDGDNYSYALHTSNSDAQLQNYLDQYQRQGRSIIDFEAYRNPSGSLLLAGVWVGDPNQPQTHLFYGLDLYELADLLNPMAGRIIDFESYFDSYGTRRYAVIIAMYPGGQWYGPLIGQTQLALIDNNDAWSDEDTHLIDLDQELNEFGSMRYFAVWGDTYKSMHEVDWITADTDPEPLSTSLQNMISDHETGGKTMGFYVKNTRTNQSLAHRADELFYLASCTKVAVHIKLWQEHQAGLDFSTEVLFTNATDSREPWWVEERSYPGLNSSHFGQMLPIERYDRAMMQRSDNAAASLLVDHPSYGLAFDSPDLNEWLSGVAGVGQGFGLITSIHDVDRTILWQGQADASYQNETSYFLIPGWAFEPYWREEDDVWGDLRSYLGLGPGDDLPLFDKDEGHQRYYNMGLNSATPRAFNRLLEGLVEGRFLDAQHTVSAIEIMQPPDGWVSLDDSPYFPAHVTAYSKGGKKGGARRPECDSAIFSYGEEKIVVVLNTRNSGGVGTINGIAPDFGLEVLQLLGVNLAFSSQPGTFSPDTVSTGDDLQLDFFICNVGGGDAPAFDIAIYFSESPGVDAIINSGLLVETVRIAGLAGDTTIPVSVQARIPASIPSGVYHVGWIIDPVVDPGDIFGEVDEWNEDVRINTGTINTGTLQVNGPLFADGFESGDLSLWTTR